MNEQLLQGLVSPGGALAGATIEAVTPVGGGCIHQASRLQLADGRRLFAKSGPADALVLFEVEAEALAALHDHADEALLLVPRPLAVSSISGGAVLLMPWMDLEGSDQQTLGRGLALLHQHSGRVSPGRFGWDRDGFIGAGPQPGGWRERWGACFVDLRLRPQLALLGDCGCPPDQLNRVLSELEARLDDHGAEPALVHGDLWGGNAGVLSDGRGAIFDPAAWWADREVDLAMTSLFGGFSRQFREAYRTILPPRPGEADRVAIYNLYHLLNHANLFGGSYVSQARASLQGLIRWML